MEKRKLIALFVIVFLSCFVSAGITISEPLDFYNLGDRIYINIDGILGSEYGNLNIDLLCNSNSSVRIAQIPVRAFDTSKEQSWSVPYKILTKSDLEITNKSLIVGTCQILASMPGQSVSTKKFTISDKININAKLEKYNFNPDEAIKVFIEAKKENGVPLDGFIEVSNATTFTKAIKKGQLIETFSLPKTTEAGVYSISIRAYDLDEQEILNEGYSNLFFEINAVASSLVLSISNEEVMPGKEFKVKAEIFDQSGKEMKGKVTLKLTGPKMEEVIKTIDSGDSLSITLPENSTKGVWKLRGYFNSISTEREIKVLENQKVSFEIENSVLTIKNIGNVPYNKSITVKFGEEEKKIDIKMDIGEVRKFSLQAPNGEYEVQVSDGDNTYKNKVMLTGKVISLNEINKNVFRDYFFLWVFLIAVLGFTGILTIIRYKKTSVVGEESKIKKKLREIKSKIFRKKEKLEDVSKNTLIKSKNAEKEKFFDVVKDKISIAEPSLVLEGKKEFSCVSVIKISNYKNLTKENISFLNDLLESAKQKKGLIDWRDDNIFIIFSPIVTRTYTNEELAIKVSNEIYSRITEHNKKFRNKIEFNIGIHSGDLVVSKEAGKLKYTSVGNTISLAKRISDFSSSKILISQDSYRKVMRDLKVNKVGEIGEKAIYEIVEIKNKEGNIEKLNQLLRRQ